MNIEKMVEIGLLFEQYKELLTDKQREIVSLYYEEDYSYGCGLSGYARSNGFLLQIQ